RLDPANLVVLHYLGLIAAQKGDFKEADRLISKVLAKGRANVEALRNLGKVRLAAGNAQGAEALLHEALELAPEDAEALTLLGAARSALRRHEAAEEALLAALEKAPGHLDALNYLGVALAAQGRQEEARDAFARGAKMARGFGEVHFNLAEAQLALGELEAAEELVRQLLKKIPGHPRLLDLLSRTLAAARQFPEALEMARAAAAAAPEDLQLAFNLAVTLQEAGEWPAAENSYRLLLEKEPTFAAAWANLGALLQKQDRIEESHEALRTALRHAPHHLEARLNLATTLEQTSRLTEAEEQLQLALQQAPEHPGLLVLAAKLERRGGRPEAAVARLAEGPDLEVSPLLRQDWFYEQGRNLDLVGRHAEAFAAFVQANDLAAEGAASFRGDRDRTRELLARATECFTREWVAAWLALESPAAEDSPIFLVGFPRSGTTLLHHILASHSRLQVLEEVEALEAARELLDAEGSSYPLLLRNLTEEQAEAARNAYWRRARAVLPVEEGRRLVDKLPLNLMHLGLIHRLWPQAPIILVLRHPYDVCLSAFMQHFDVNDAMANFFSLEDATDFYDRVMTLFERYQDSLSLPVIAVRYEDLLADFDGEVGKLLTALSLEWEEDVRHFTRTAKQRTRINTPSYSQVTEDLYKRALYRWENYQDFLAPLPSRIGRWARHFGYDSEGRRT
ncbi:MAG TPA: sulfotransferase, partial [Kiloniellales bacterium]|nr:sulfotransferase [Kiloniellales bacterium]